jgi:hypothetical protein
MIHHRPQAMGHISQTPEAKAKFLSNPILEHGATLLRQRHAVKDYFPKRNSTEKQPTTRLISTHGTSMMRLLQSSF